MITLNWDTKNSSKELASFDSSVKSIEKTDKNLLINADNLIALKALQKNYTSLVDVIYIDPPYNTKNHKFLYDDKFDTHTNWLDFIYPRLIMACGLLCEDGVIFISIDDNEVAHLKLLCNEIFGEENFVSEFVWQKKNKPSFLHKKVARMNEFVLCFAKDINKLSPLSIEDTKESTKYPLNFKNNPVNTLVFKSKKVSFKLKDGVVKASDMSTETIKSILLDDVEIKNGKNVNDFRMSGSWRYTQKYLDTLLKDGAKLSVAQAPFRINLQKLQSKPKIMTNFLTKPTCHVPTYEDANSEIIELFGFEAFTKAKPVGLVKTLIKSVTRDKKDALILDFFGGSGTSAHAVMELNNEDKGSRKFILVQDTHKIDEKHESYKRGYKTIYEIMRKRVFMACGKFKEEFVEYNL